MVSPAQAVPLFPAFEACPAFLWCAEGRAPRTVPSSLFVPWHDIPALNLSRLAIHPPTWHPLWHPRPKSRYCKLHCHPEVPSM
jgi:hypothetical protein